MSNTTIPLVILTWLRQLQEHFFEQSEIKELIDWNDFGQYCNVPLKFAVTKGVNNVHMSKANTANAVKIEFFDSIKPNKKDSKKSVKSLFEWAERILHWESPYVQDIAKSIERGSTSLPPKYNMTDKNYQRITQDETNISDIEKFAPEDQRRKTPEQLMSIIGSFMINEIERMPKNVSQKNKDLLNNANWAAGCLVEYVNEVRSGEKNFKLLQEMTKHMAKESETQNKKNDSESSAEEEEDEYD